MMLELLEKIRSRKILFLLLLAPLLFTPVKEQVGHVGIDTDTEYMGDYEGGYAYGWGYGYGYAGWEYVGIALGGPFLSLGNVLVFEAGWEDWGNDYRNSQLFIDWGRITYWELWVLLTYFYIVPWRRNIVPWYRSRLQDSLPK